MPLMMVLVLLGCDEGPTGAWALDYAGQPDCVSVVDAPALNPPFTVELWARLDPEAAPAERPLLSWQGLVELRFDEQDMLGVYLENVLVSAYAVPLDRGVDHHLTVTYDAADLRLYVDGAVVTLAAIEYDGTPGSTLYIGCNRGAEAFWGVLDELRISSTARYADTFLVPADPHQPDPDTLLLFPFDEGEGETATDLVSGVVATVAGPTWISGNLGKKP